MSDYKNSKPLLHLHLPVDECLRVELAKVGEHLVDEPRHERARRVYPGDQLWDHLQPRIINIYNILIQNVSELKY